MQLRLAILGGVIPATVLALVLLAAGLLTSRAAGSARRRGAAPGAPDASPVRAPPPPSTTEAPPAPPGDVPPSIEPADASSTPRTRLSRPIGLAWIVGAALALPIIYYTTWSWPVVWPKDATYRLLHVAAIMLAWSLVEHVVPRVPPPARTIGRFLAVFAGMFVLLQPYQAVLGWGKVVGGGAAGAALAVLCTGLSVRAQARHHPAWAMACLFLSAAGGIGVLLLGKTATAAQASAGLAALAASTGVASLITRRSTPTHAAAFVLSGLLAWLLAVGCFGTGQTNLASSALLLLAPLGLALPIPRVDLFWKKWSPALAVGGAWALVCVGAAVAIAVLTQPPAPPDYGY